VLSVWGAPNHMGLSSAPKEASFGPPSTSPELVLLTEVRFDPFEAAIEGTEADPRVSFDILSKHTASRLEAKVRVKRPCICWCSAVILPGAALP
jgi:hypothetical protein